MRGDPIRTRWRDRQTGQAGPDENPLEALAGELLRAAGSTQARTPQASASLFAKLRERRGSKVFAVWRVFALRPLAVALSLFVSINLALAVTVTPVQQWWSRVLQIDVDQLRPTHHVRVASARSTRDAPPDAIPAPAPEMAPPVLAAALTSPFPGDATGVLGVDSQAPVIAGQPHPGRLARARVPSIQPNGEQPAKPERSPPAPTAASPEKPNESLAAESELISRALAALSAHKPAQALAAIAAYRARFPQGGLAYEATLAEVKAQLASGHDSLAREALETAMATQGFEGLPRSSELTLLHAELQARARDCAAALPTFDRLSRATDLDSPLAERALYGRASCLASQGDQASSREALEGYLRRFPAGRFASAARAALGASE